MDVPGHTTERVNVNGTTLEWFDVLSCRRTRSWTLPFAHTNDFEMGPSRDGRRIALGDGNRAFVVEMDPLPGRIGPPRTVNELGGTIHSINMSPSGHFVVVGYSGDSQRVFDVNETTLALTPRVYAGSTPECSGHDPSQGYIFDLGHADMTFDPYDGGAEVIVGQRRSWCSGTSQVQSIRLSDGAVKNLAPPTPGAFSYYVSCRAYDRPGWAYVSWWPTPGTPFNDEITAVRLDGGAVERYAHDHTDTSGCYPMRVSPGAFAGRDADTLRQQLVAAGRRHADRPPGLRAGHPWNDPLRVAAQIGRRKSHSMQASLARMAPGTFCVNDFQGP